MSQTIEYTHFTNHFWLQNIPQIMLKKHRAAAVVQSVTKVKTHYPFIMIMWIDRTESGNVANVER